MDFFNDINLKSAYILEETLFVLKAQNLFFLQI